MEIDKLIDACHKAKHKYGTNQIMVEVNGQPVKDIEVLEFHDPGMVSYVLNITSLKKE